jgi:hypothetical protein
MRGLMVRVSRARRRQLAAVMCAAAVLASASPASPAGAASAASAASAATAGIHEGKTPRAAYWVSPHGRSHAPDTSCRTAGYATIQTAVNAAAKHRGRRIPTIEICPGTYVEQVTITRSMTLTRAPGSPHAGPVTIELPAAIAQSTTNCQARDDGTGTQAVVEICAARRHGVNTTGTKVAIHDVTVAGNWTTEPTCDDNRYDVYVAGGASLLLTGSTVEKAGLAIPLSGACQVDYGVEVGWQLSRQIGHAELINDRIESYQKNGITVDGPGSTADIFHDVVTGSGPTPIIAQNGIQISFGAKALVADNIITGNNYTGDKGASSAGILAFGGGGKACGNGAFSPLVRQARFISNRLAGNDVGILLANYNASCTRSTASFTGDVACRNVIQNSNGYPHGQPSADANTTGWSMTPAVGYQAGISDAGNRDVICDNAIYGAGYAPLGATRSLPKPAPPAFVRPVDIVSSEGWGPAIRPIVCGNSFDGRPYRPRG